jgi:hypothetical protein
MLRSTSGPIKIFILGGDLLVSRALEAVLREAGYDARFVGGFFLTDEPLDEEVGVVILAPRMSSERRKLYLNHAKGTPATAGVPALELLTTAASRNGREEPVYPVAWPCPMGGSRGRSRGIYAQRK